MFDDINLLPEDLRRKEEKEKKRQERGQEFTAEELSFPPFRKGKGEGLEFKIKEKPEPKGSWQIKEKPEEVKKAEPKAVTSEKKVGWWRKLKNLFKRKVAVEKIKVSEEKREELKPVIPFEEKPKAAKIEEQRKEVIRPLSEIPPRVEIKAAVKEERGAVPPFKKEKVKIPESPLEKEKKFNFKKIFSFLKLKPKIISLGEGGQKVEKVSGLAGFSPGDKLTAPSDSLEVNLAPSLRELQPLSQISAYLIWTIIINLLLVGILYGVIILYNFQIQIKAEAQDQRIAEKLAVIDKVKPQEEEVKNLLNEIERIEQLLKKHIYWTKFFTALENYTLENVYYTGLAATSEGNINLEAVTSDYQSVAKQIITLENSENFIKTIKVLAATKTAATDTTSAKVSFEISLVLDPEVFLTPLTYE